MRLGANLHDWRFEEEIDHGRLEDLGMAAIFQALRARRWVHRRVESVEFESADTARRTVRLDLTVPIPPPELSERLGDVSLIPVGFLQKQRKFRPLACRSSDQTELPVLTQRTRNAIAAKGLVAYARGAFANRNVDQAALEKFLGKLEGIVTESIAKGVAAARPFLPERSGSAVIPTAVDTSKPLETAEEFTQVLRAHPLFPTIAWNLATHSMLLVRLPVKAGERCSVTYSHEEKIAPEPVSWMARVLRFAGFYAHRVQFPALSAADAGSFHFLFTAPPGVQVTRGELRISRTPLTAYSMRRGTLDSAVEKERESDTTGWGRRFSMELVDEEAGSMASAHLFSSDLPVDHNGSTWFNLRPLGTVLLPPAWLTTVIVAAITTAVAVSTPAFDLDSATTLLLVGPSALALYIVRPLENRLTTRLLFGARAIVTVAGLISFTTAVLLELGSQGWFARALWNTLPSLVWVGVGVLTLAWLITWKKFRDRVAHMPFMRDERAKRKYEKLQGESGAGG